MNITLSSLTNYQSWLTEIKQRIASARTRTALAANSELITLYYELGAQIVDREAHTKWGSGFIDALSKDIKQAFPEMSGFSSKNLRYCRPFSAFTVTPQFGNRPLPNQHSPWGPP